MPQLNPSPWLFIMVLTWLALMTVFLNKTLLTEHPNSPMMNQHTTKTPSWTWPWS
uniref:ATP synthase complex subunit 8 n=1 Tax=Chalarodon madagascariensis TaxID=44147 RepID=C4T8D9_9SAUR|nr:ATP synthase F0 subunit 8 [Chalarodon madagascariensis]BAH70451.1 ATPase subunit 8 [Chalarodon madagascariensis]